ncbi:MAG: hypothetical protein KGI80_02155 [Verrucomicrobiota bacterium]|nr:hypothetical protein [Verrucomicrobiota bacterium]
MNPRLSSLLSFVFPLGLSAMLVGNPAEPALETEGIFTSPAAWCTLRLAFFEDYIYYQRLVEKFTVEGNSERSSFARLGTSAGILTLNCKNRLDLYGIGGGSKLQVNEQTFTSTAPCWGGGGKWLFLRTHNIFGSVDVKYFSTDQTPRYFLEEGLAYVPVGDTELSYTETQVAVGLSFLTKPLSPYIYGTYLTAKLTPHPTKILVRIPQDDFLGDALLNTEESQRHFGMALGATFVSGEKISLAVESRLFNQNALDAKLEVRF